MKIATIAGFAATKVGARLDRSQWREVKDARDLVLAAYWHEHSNDVGDRLYDTDDGNSVLVAERGDVPRAAAHLLGIDIAATIGERRLAEPATRWPGDFNLLVREFTVANATALSDTRRGAIVEALTSGLPRRGSH